MNKIPKYFIGGVHRAAFDAVIVPFLPHMRKDRHFTAVPSLAQGHRWLVSRWRTRIFEMADAGWVPALASATQSASYNRTCLCNCPDFSQRDPPSQGGPRHRTCKRQRICPMCYARMVVMPLYDAFHWALYGTDGVISRPDMKPSVMSTQRILPIDSHPVQGILDYFKSNRGLPDDLAGVVGGTATLDMIHPYSETHLAFRRHTFMLSSASKSLVSLSASLSSDDQLKRSLHWLEPSAVNSKSLAHLIGRAAGYPIGMLLGDASVATQICNTAAKDRSRMLVFTGWLRNEAARKAAYHLRKAVADEEIEERGLVSCEKITD